ncbi:hypothetical protein HK104_010755 [Borealophlyctis nickersoniae]|nr:hypothetical protein HK104_010755 [Borealophlyctis nickersoniae]
MSTMRQRTPSPLGVSHEPRTYMPSGRSTPSGHSKPPLASPNLLAPPDLSVSPSSSSSSSTHSANSSTLGVPKTTTKFPLVSPRTEASLPRPSAPPRRDSQTPFPLAVDADDYLGVGRPGVNIIENRGDLAPAGRLPPLLQPPRPNHIDLGMSPSSDFVEIVVTPPLNNDDKNAFEEAIAAAIPPVDFLKLEKAVAAHIPGLPDEIEVSIGDEIAVQKRFDDGWMYGRNMTTKQRGVFPGGCLGIVPPTPCSILADPAFLLTPVDQARKSSIAPSAEGPPSPEPPQASGPCYNKAPIVALQKAASLPHGPKPLFRRTVRLEEEQAKRNQIRKLIFVTVVCMMTLVVVLGLGLGFGKVPPPPSVSAPTAAARAGTVAGRINEAAERVGSGTVGESTERDRREARPSRAVRDIHDA